MIATLRGIARHPYVRLGLAMAAATWGITTMQNHVNELVEQADAKKTELADLTAQVTEATAAAYRLGQTIESMRDYLQQMEQAAAARHAEKVAVDVVVVDGEDVDEAPAYPGQDDLDPLSRGETP